MDRKARPRIVLFHGLNNNQECFRPLLRSMNELGFETDLIILPGHGNERLESGELSKAIRDFDLEMKRFEGIPYYAIAFSHGALYLQIWLQKNPSNAPLKQVLLAPALFLRNQSFLFKLLPFLPAKLPIKSFSPKPLRRYQSLTPKDYQVLFRMLETWQKWKKEFRIPTLVLIDPKDELVDAQALQNKMEEFHGGKIRMIEKKTKRRIRGYHHILFHPEYFEPTEWSELLEAVTDFFEEIGGITFH